MTEMRSLWPLIMGMVLACLLAARSVADMPPADQEVVDFSALLAAADAVRLPFTEGRVSIVLTRLEDDREADRSEYTVLFASNGDSRIEMEDPRVRGQRVLLSNKGLWLFTPRSHRSIRLTPLQRLMGQASYGDIGRMRWARDYQVVEGRRDADGQWRLRLEAKAGTAVYSRIDLSLAADGATPLRADFFLASGKRFKSAVFAPPVRFRDRLVIDTVTFREDRAPEARTIMTLGGFQPQTLPARLFTVRGLRD